MAETQQAWRAMESHVPTKVRSLGISNIYHPEILRALYNFATVKPSVVQNRFYPDTGYDGGIRAFCSEKGIVYQSFWTLTANPHLLRSRVVGALAEKVGVSKPVALYALVLGLGRVSVLDGTTKAERMREDLDGLHKVNKWREDNADWEGALEKFQALLN